MVDTDHRAPIKVAPGFGERQCFYHTARFLPFLPHRTVPKRLIILLFQHICRSKNPSPQGRILNGDSDFHTYSHQKGAIFDDNRPVTGHPAPLGGQDRRTGCSGSGKRKVDLDPPALGLSGSPPAPTARPPCRLRWRSGRRQRTSPIAGSDI